MPKKKDPPEKPDDQFQRFMEAAKAAGVDEKTSEDEFKRLARKSKKKSGAQ